MVDTKCSEWNKGELEVQIRVLKHKDQGRKKGKTISILGKVEK